MGKNWFNQLKMIVRYNYKNRTGSSWKKNGKNNFEKKVLKKKFGKKYFETKILIRKIYNTMNQCGTIFALLAPLDKNRTKDGE